MRVLFLLLAFSYSFSAFAQDLDYAKRIIDTLTSQRMAGRGYINRGDFKAAQFIKKQYQSIGLKQFKGGYFQTFYLDVNTFPGEVYAAINNEELKPGKDYIVDPESSGTKERLYLGIYNLTPEDLASKDKFKKLKKKVKSKALFIDNETFKDYHKNQFFEDIDDNKVNAAAIVYLEKKLIWSVGRKEKGYPIVHLLKDSLPAKPQSFYLDIDEEMVRDYKTQNVISYIEGKTYPDSFIVFTGHYDHLGMMGNKTYFPGANDNASGIAFMLDLARYYVQKDNKPDYSIAIMAFAAEEAGLVGSYFYNFKPYFPLDQIAVLFNFDLIGNGQDGVMVVNGKVFEKEYNRLVEINNENNYLKTVKKRGKAANSDHYFFSENGVTAFFMYLLGDYPYYHDIYDKPERLSLAGYEGLFKLLRDYVKDYSTEHTEK